MKKLLLLCALMCACVPVRAQTATASGTKVLNGSGALLSSGQWCFNATCLTVTAGAFSGSVTTGTQTVTVTDGSSTTYLTVPSVTISGTFSWDTYVVPANASISGMGMPRIACTPGAAYTQTDGIGAMWNCISSAGQATWVTNSPLYPAPPGTYISAGAPAFACISPCLYVRNDSSPLSQSIYSLMAPSGSSGNTWGLPSSVIVGNGSYFMNLGPQHTQTSNWNFDSASPLYARRSLGSDVQFDAVSVENPIISSTMPVAPPNQQLIQWGCAGNQCSGSVAAPIPSIALAPAGALLCAKGSDTTISALSVTSFSLSGTVATIGVGSSPSAAQYMIGQTIGVLGVTPSGLNGQYQITAISGSQITATALGSQSGSYSSGGTVYMPCANSTDATTGSPQGFSASLTIPAATTYPTYYSISALFATWTTATVPSMVVPLLQMNGSTVALWNGVATGFRVSAAGVSASEAWSFAMPYSGKLQASSDRQTFGSVTGSGQVVLTNATTSSPMALTLKGGFAPAGVGAGSSYSTGASSCTDGTQAVTFTNGAGTGGTGTITVSGGAPSGAVTVTNTGYGYTSQPTQGTVATCSGTATFSGGSLGGAQGNALWLMLFRAQQQQ